MASSNKCENSSSSEELCIVCYKPLLIYSVGECDHPVCFECSTRMRVVCGQDECPICRQKMSKVIFSDTLGTYRELDTNLRSGLYDKPYRISFANSQIRAAYFKLLEHQCPICKHLPFNSFEQLKDHVRKAHEMFYCDLCSEHLKIFSSERRCYTRDKLAMHRRVGDLDDKSHKGHPRCEYCDRRYLDRDELYKHLRKDHFYCHFCDVDGLNEYYENYEALREHQRAYHFLCEEGDCGRDEFPPVFRTEIDFRAHIANVHAKSLSKQAARQARTLEVEFTLTPRNNVTRNARRYNEQRELNIIEPIQTPAVRINTENEEEFPSLVGNSSAAPVIRPSVSIRTKFGPYKNKKEDFPALGGGKSRPDPDPNLSRGQAASSVLKTGVVKKPINHTKGGMVIHVSNRPNNINGTVSKNDFPSLGSNSKSKQLQEDFSPQMTSNVNMGAVSAKHKSLVENNYGSMATTLSAKLALVKPSEPKPVRQPEAFSVPKLNSKNNFPELGPSATPGSAPLWVAKTKPKVESKHSKIAPAPLLPNSQKEEANNKKKQELKSNMSKEDAKPMTGKNIEKKEKSKAKREFDVKNTIVDLNSKLKTTDESKMTKLQKSKKNDNGLTDLQNGASGYSFPPGLHTMTNGQPPPGFSNVKLNSVVKTSNNLTFENSLGQKYNIIPSHNYLPPDDVAERNSALVMNFQMALKSSDAYEQFKEFSKMFRNGSYHALPYYEHCRSALGDQFDDVFPELLALLPNISKQQELYLVHCQQLHADRKERPPKSYKKAVEQLLEVCSTCKQVVTSKDLQAHLNYHRIENNFPALSINKEGNQMATTFRS